MNLSPIKMSNEPKGYPSPLSKRLSPLSIIHTFQSATSNLSSQNYCQWYSSAVNLIKLIDFPISHDLESASSNLKSLPFLILEISKKPIATEGFKSTCGVILNLLSKANLVEECLKEAVMEFLAAIFQQFVPRKGINSSHKRFEKTRGFVGLKNDLLSENKKQYGLDSFLDICRIQNDKNISVNVCDEFGRFVISDKLSENIFENKKEILFKSSLFDLMIPLSFEYLRRKTQKESLSTLQEINSDGVFSYTIYSQNAKKKYLKFLNKFRQEMNHPNSSNIQKNTNQADSEPSIKGIELFYKFLKGLTSRVRRAEMKIDRKMIEELVNEEVNQEYPFIINKKHPYISSILEDKWNNDGECILDVALLETRVSKHIQKFDYLYMKFDPKIKNQEEKIQNKIRKKLKKEEDDIKEESPMNMKNELENLKNEGENDRKMEFPHFD